MDRTILLQLAFFAGTAILDMILRHSCAHDTQIVQGRLYAVIGTAACCDLEFMRQGYPTIALIEACMDFIAQRIGIIQTILTGVALQETTGRTLLPVPPTESPAFARCAQKASIS